MNTLLAYKVQMFPAVVRKSRVQVINRLLNAGWSQDEIDNNVDSAIAWANSQCLVANQEKLRKSRQAKKQKVRGDDALDAMFSACGADPSEIPLRNKIGAE
jgi:hypothetical protein